MSPQTGELLVREIAPRIPPLVTSAKPIGCDDPEELAQDAIAIAATLLLSAQARGKQVTPGNIAYYAAGLVRQGRRSTGAGKTDVLHPCTQIHGRSIVISLDAPLTNDGDGEEITCLHETLVGCAEDPSIAASRRLDWEPLVASLNANAKKVLACLVHGEDLTTLVPKLRRSRSSLQNDKNDLAKAVREHLGTDCLKQVQELPRWRDNVTASRERLACRYERQAAQ